MFIWAIKQKKSDWRTCFSDLNKAHLIELWKKKKKSKVVKKRFPILTSASFL